MGKKAKIWLMIAFSLVLVGCIIVAGILAVLNRDFTKLSTVKYETNAYNIHEDYQNISIVTNTADIAFVPSENGESTVTCYEQKNAKHFVAVNDGTLIIELVDSRKWYEFIGIHFGTPKITIYLPAGEYGTLSAKGDTGDLEVPKDFLFESMDVSVSTGSITSYASVSDAVKLKTSTGNIRVENISAGELALSVSTGGVSVSNVTCGEDVAIHVSTGKAKLTDIACKNVISDGDTGDLSLKNVIAAENFSITRSTGDVRLDGCDASEISIVTDTGDVRGSLLTGKVFITESDTGRVDVPKTVTGGKCEITTSTGDIHISLQGH